MEPIHYDLWERLENFVGSACEGRDSSHGLPHMRAVTELALLLCMMESDPSKSDMIRCSRLSTKVARVVLIAMMHDVNDHKYEKKGEKTPSDEINQFLESLLKSDTLHQLLFQPETGGHAEQEQTASAESHTIRKEELEIIMATISAISFSKEKRNGKRYFEAALGPSWTQVRDYVSDADKLEAIGERGLIRCWEFGLEQNKCEVPVEKNVRRHRNLQHVLEHMDEKLLKLKDDYIVTAQGKRLAAGRQKDMIALAKHWQMYGPPPIA